MLRDYQIEICSRVREAFEKHRSVMMQMPTGTGKTVVLAEMVRQYLNSYAVGHCNSYGDGDNDAAGNGTSCAERCRVDQQDAQPDVCPSGYHHFPIIRKHRG